MTSAIALNFVTPGPDSQVRFVLDNGWSGTRQERREVPLTDLRGQPVPSLERDGFCLSRITSGVHDYDDPAQLQDRWFPAVREAVLAATGARWATLFAGPLLRFSNRHPRSTGSSVSAPARAVHADLPAGFRFFDVERQPVADIAAQEVRAEFGTTPPARWRVFNIWQMISSPPQDNTLAMCRLPSVAEGDLVTGKGYFDEPGRDPQAIIAAKGVAHDFDITFFRHNPAQQWCWFSGMEPGEALIFSTFDPEEPVLNARTPHASIGLGDDPALQPRRSIEIRALVVW